MEEVEWNNLIPGERYYIERNYVSKDDEFLQRASGKKVGIFVRLDLISEVLREHPYNMLVLGI